VKELFQYFPQGNFGKRKLQGEEILWIGMEKERFRSEKFSCLKRFMKDQTNMLDCRLKEFLH